MKALPGFQFVYMTSSVFFLYYYNLIMAGFHRNLSFGLAGAGHMVFALLSFTSPTFCGGPRNASKDSYGVDYLC